ncbi:hypothetical protein BXY66_2805 [Shimia isoporae]|uniref:Uncharacterized protein n=1 Tax=Shimia isoporae TaxID=647720 RepID=A0A4R1N5V1_9RHOB|nr:hypothetical protein BXY66_2805 [Shimia isoporae]
MYFNLCRTTETSHKPMVIPNLMFRKRGKTRISGELLPMTPSWTSN